MSYFRLAANCFWWECNACEGEDCADCKLFLCPQDKRYYDLNGSYSQDIEEAAMPVFAKYKEMFEEEKKKVNTI